MTDQEDRLLAALAWMCVQYLERDYGLDHMSMSAGEEAMVLLEEYGLVDSWQRGAQWTESGKTFLRAHMRSN